MNLNQKKSQILPDLGQYHRPTYQDYIFYIYCIMLFLTGLLSTLGTKILQYHYKYDNYWIIIFYMYICFIVNIFIYLKDHNYKQLILLFKNIKLLKKLTIPAIIYTIETGILWFSFSNIPISAYIIARTSNSFFNVPFTKYYLKKNIPNLYYLGLLLLLCSYILLSLNFLNFSDTNAISILSLVILFCSGISTATYNNMVEYHLTTFEKIPLVERQHTILEIKLFYQIVANMYGFIILWPIATIFCGYDKLFNPSITPNILFLIAGFCGQVYFLFKILILGYTKIVGNHILSSIDLLRRVVINIIAITVFNEYCNTEIIIANICMFIGSVLFIVGQLNFNKTKNHIITENNKYIVLENIVDEEINIYENDHDNSIL